MAYAGAGRPSHGRGRHRRAGTGDGLRAAPGAQLRPGPDRLPRRRGPGAPGGGAAGAGPDRRLPGGRGAHRGAGGADRRTVDAGGAPVADRRRRRPGRTAGVSWTPASVAEIHDEYKIDLGDGNLDLTGVDFTGQDVTIELTVNAGNLQVIVPPDVDVVGDADVSFGSASIVGREIDAAGGSDEDFSDLGEDRATGPGRITLDVKVNAGNLEVTR